MAPTDPTPPRRRGLRLLLIVLAAVILLPVLAVLALVVTFDADSAKPRIVAAVREATGRDLVIAGPIRLVLALHPGIELTDAALSNPPGFSRPQMAMLKRLNLQVALLPLLQRRIEIDRLVMSGADILLEMNADGIGNWRFTPSPAGPPQAGGKSAPAAAKSATPSIHIDRIEIENGQIAYRNARMAAPAVLAIGALNLTTGAADQPTRLSMAASADGAPFTLSGSMFPSNALFGGITAPLSLDLKAAAAGAVLSLAGKIADPVRLSGADLRVSADIPDLAALSDLAHVALPRLRGIIAQAQLTDLAGKPPAGSLGLLAGFRLRDLKITSSLADLDGEISVIREARPRLQGRLHAGRIDAAALRAVLPPDAGQPAAEGIAPKPAPEPPLTPRARLIPDQDLPLELLRAADADLTLTVDELIQGGVSYRDLALHAVLNDAALRIDPLTVTLPGGPVRASLAIDAAKPIPPVALKLSAAALGVAPLLSAFALPPYAQGNLQIDADLHGAGRSLHQLAATLDGSVGLSMENAQFDTRMLGEALNGIGMLKNGTAGLTALRCLAVRMDARNGVGTLRTLLLDTAPVRLSGTGSLNLGEETLAIRLQTTVRLGATGIGAPFDLTGTLLAPKLKIDTARPGAGAGANTPFGLVIGKLGLDRLVQGATGDTCAHDLAVARGQTPPEPAAEPPAQRDAKPPKPADLLRQLLR